MTAVLTCWGVYDEQRIDRWPAARMTTPRAWPTANALRALVPK